ncbi:MAG: lysozyme [Alphaproteobacteria bacterium]|nr:lysozyme [Alphaproteobacteria bacterium]
MRHITESGLALIRRFEGYSATPYLCPAGYLTVGYGHVVRGPEDEMYLNEEEALLLLQHDVRRAEQAVLRQITVPLSDRQFDALVSFTYNLGAGALQRSTLRRKVNRSEHADVPDEFRRWIWAGGKKLPGLIRRRAAEAVLYAAAD